MHTFRKFMPGDEPSPVLQLNCRASTRESALLKGGPVPPALVAWHGTRQTMVVNE